VFWFNKSAYVSRSEILIARPVKTIRKYGLPERAHLGHGFFSFKTFSSFAIGC
jgi:hypothetical protein